MYARVSTNSVEFPAIFNEACSESGPFGRASPNEFSYSKGTEIFGEKEPPDYIYQIATDAVRSYKLLSDGLRHIGAFHLVGAIFGHEIESDHHFTAEPV